MINILKSKECTQTVLVSLGTKLIKILGKKYVTTVLPKKIYKSFPTVLKTQLSEGAFIGFWNGTILLGPLDAVKDSVTDFCKQYTWGWVAETAGVIAQGLVWAII